MGSKGAHNIVSTILFALVAIAILYIFTCRMEGFQDATDLNAPLRSSVSTYPLCFLCVAPPKEYLKTLVPFTETQTVYVLCDNNEYVPPESPDFKTVKITERDAATSHPVIPGVLYIVQIQDDICGKAGYINSASTIPKKPSAWDKAIYYFCVKNMAPHVWFVEEDVFIPRANIFDEMNGRYPNTDLVGKQHVSETEDPGFFWWFDAEGKMERPYYRCLVCAVRISRNIFREIATMAAEKKTICFVETLFSTIVEHKKFTKEMAPELQSVIFRHNWTKDTVHKNGLFHPVKDVKDHIEFKQHLDAAPLA